MADHRPGFPIEITESDLKAAARHTLVYDHERRKWRKERPLIQTVSRLIYYFRNGLRQAARKP